jgi:protein O-GlcNAc transferase
MRNAQRIAALRGAVEALSEGRLADVLAACGPVLAADPEARDARALVKAAGCRAEAAGLVDAAAGALIGVGAVRDAAEVRLAAVRRTPTVPRAWAALATLQERGGDAGAAERTLRMGVEHVGDPVGLRCQLALVLARQDRAQEALAEADAAMAAAPDRLRPVWTALRCMPLVHDDAAGLEQARAAQEGRLGVFEAAAARVTPTRARAALGFAQDRFPAHYACRPDDTALQRRFGAAVHQLVRTAHPELVAAMPAGPARGRLRVGFVSSLLCRHTISKLFGAWVRDLDADRFDVHVWQLGRVDDTTRGLLRGGATLHTGEGRGPVRIGGAIRAAGLDAVVFPEVGMDARVMTLAAMRLAPFQAVAWGHPVTTGLPTVDAFLSAAAMERGGAAADYTEALVPLPGLGTDFARPPAPARRRDRADFGLPEGAPLYLCTQSLFKLLPRQDAVFRRILEAVPGAQLALLRLPGAPRTLARLARAGLPMDRVHAVPPQRFGDFLDLNAVCDVVLDGLDWSGGVTTLEAVACGRVPLTLAGSLMRTRHTAAILEALGIPELIAQDEDTYVATAVRLGTDPAWRAELEARAAAAAPSLYGDARSTEALAALLEARRG